MGSEPLSRRSLFTLGRDRVAPAPSAVDHEALLARQVARWDGGASALLRAFEPLAEIAGDAAEVARGDAVLDVGAGDGNVALAAARRGATVSACDLAPGMVRRGRERTAAAGVEVTWARADVQTLLPYPDGRFDVVLSVLGAALASRPRRAARELMRVLRPGGRLLIAAPAPRSLTGRALRLAADPAPAPREWASPRVARERIEAAAPGTDVVLRECTFELAFASEALAWAAYEAPFGLPPSARDDFADAVTASSSARGSVRVEETWRLVLARRSG